MTLPDLLQEDVAFGALYLRFREVLFPAVLKASKFESRRKLDGAKYELANIFSRLYMCARNEEVPVVDVFQKMLSELEEKQFTVPEAIRNVSVAKNFSLDTGSDSSSWLVFRKMSFIEQDASATWSYCNPELVEHCSKLSITVSKAKLLSLRERCDHFLGQLRADGVATMVGQEEITTELVLRVTAFSYMVASGSLYWGFGPDAYNFVKDELGGVIELYASPFNHTLEHFCSPFELDKVYKSLGSFYKVDWSQVLSRDMFSGIKSDEDRIVVIANPPYIESEIELCCRSVESLMQNHGSKIKMVLSICPAWDGAKGIVSLQKSKFKVYERRLLPCEHSYYNYQTFKWVAATFPSLGFGFHADCQNALLAVDTLGRKQVASEIEKVFDKLKEDTIGLHAAKRRRMSTDNSK